MIFNNLEFHNVAEITEEKYGFRLHRFPANVRREFGSVEDSSTFGRYIGELTTGCEIRFVTPGDRALVSLSSFDEDGIVAIYRGDFKVGYKKIEAGKVNHLMLEVHNNFNSIPEAYLQGDFSPNVWRVMSCHDFGMVFCGIDTFGQDVRPPLSEEKPKKTLLAYGTSLTHGACAQAYPICYTNYLARLLHADLLNKGMGGSCMNENAVADFIAASDWDALYFENMANMGEGMARQYEEQTKYLLDTVTRAHPNKPIYTNTIFPLYWVAGADPVNPLIKKPFVLDDILRKLVKNYKNVTLIEGDTLLTDFHYLMSDGVHLNDFGQVQVAQNLAKVVKF